MTTPIEQIQADMAAMRTDVTNLQERVASLQTRVNTADEAAQQKTRRIDDWLRRNRETPPTEPTDPKPRTPEGRM